MHWLVGGIGSTNACPLCGISSFVCAVESLEFLYF